MTPELYVRKNIIFSATQQKSIKDNDIVYVDSTKSLMFVEDDDDKKWIIDWVNDYVYLGIAREGMDDPDYKDIQFINGHTIVFSRDVSLTNDPFWFHDGIMGLYALNNINNDVLFVTIKPEDSTLNLWLVSRDVQEQKGFVSQCEQELLDFAFEDGVMQTFSGDTEQQQDKYLCAYLQRDTIPRLEDFGTRWTDLFAGYCDASAVNESMQNALAACGYKGVTPVFTQEGSKLKVSFN